jgi:hypothetical protein
MVDTMLRRNRRRSAGRKPGRAAAAAASYTAMGWPVCPGAYPPARPHRGSGAARGCSCDRIGCPAPGAHPVSAAWKVEATSDPAAAGAMWSARPDANVILVTGRVFDVLDVPAPVGLIALGLMARAHQEPGPVALSAGDRALFFVGTRGAPADEQEWWSCHLDCAPEEISGIRDVPELAGLPGLRWHCRDSYVVAPESQQPGGGLGRWVHEPAAHPLPDGVRLLEVLADAFEGAGR